MSEGSTNHGCGDDELEVVVDRQRHERDVRRVGRRSDRELSCSARVKFMVVRGGGKDESLR